MDGIKRTMESIQIRAFNNEFIRWNRLPTRIKEAYKSVLDVSRKYHNDNEVKNLVLATFTSLLDQCTPSLKFQIIDLISKRREVSQEQESLRIALLTEIHSFKKVDLVPDKPVVVSKVEKPQRNAVPTNRSTIIGHIKEISRDVYQSPFTDKLTIGLLSTIAAFLIFAPKVSQHDVGQKRYGTTELPATAPQENPPKSE
jgi:hypothetical protein